MKMHISSHLKIIFLITISSLCYSQNRPIWFDETGVYRNWIARENVSQFDSKIRTSGIPAWGSWFTLTNGEQGLQEEVAYHHAMGKFYIPSITFRSIGRPDTVYYPIDSIAARDVNGNVTMPFERVSTSICSPTWKEALKTYLRAIVDAGGDGVLFDDTNIDMENSFDKYSMIEFRTYLKRKFTSNELLTLFNIQNIDNFNYREWIAAHGQLNSWVGLPLDGLKEEFWKFVIDITRSVFMEISSYVKNYARDTHQKDFTVSCNVFYGGLSDFDIYFDLIDYPVGEAHLFGKTYQRTRFGPTYSTGYEVHDFMALTNKIRRSIKDWPVLPLCEPEGYSFFNYPAQLNNLMRTIFADAYASQGLVLLNPMFDCFDHDHIHFNAIGYDYDITGRYANFIYANPKLFNKLSFNPRIGLLYSMSSQNRKTFFDSNGLPVTSFYGTGQFLIDHSIPFDVIFAPETRFSTLPDITLTKLQQYERIILPNTTNLNDNQVQIILDYVTGGGTVIALGDIGINGEDGRAAARATLQNLQTANGEKIRGLGKFIYFKEERAFGKEYGSYYWAYPEQNGTEFQNFLAPYITPEMGITGTTNVSGFIYLKNNNYIIHLVNYDYDIPSDHITSKQNFNVRIQPYETKSWQAVYVSPDFNGQQILTATNDNSHISVTIPNLDAYGILVLQDNKSAPQITSRNPSNDATIVAGNSANFSVQVQDPDNNPLYYQWYLDGVIIPLAIESSYSYQTIRSESGSHNISVEISDGSNKITTQWQVTIQAYVFPKILFDEIHKEINTISLQRAQALNPEHPDWVYFSTLKSKLDTDYFTERIESGNITSSILQNYHVLFISAPDSAFSSTEISAIVNFVSNGGGLIILGDCGIPTDINNLLQTFGIQFSNPLVCETVNQGMGYGNPTVSNFINHPALGSNPGLNMNWGGCLNTTSPAVALGFTDINTWSDTNWNAINDAGEPQGPLTIVTAAEYGKGKVFCISDNPFNDAILSSVTCPNDDIIINALSWLTENINQLTSISETNNEILSDFQLFQNYPNPFNPSTKIEYSLPKETNIKITVFDILGREVKVIENGIKKAGRQFSIWDGKTSTGIQAVSGVYFYTVKTSDFSKTNKMILMK